MAKRMSKVDSLCDANGAPTSKYCEFLKLAMFNQWVKLNIDIDWGECLFNRMVKLGEEQRNRIFHALADSTRRSLLERIAQADASVAELKEPFPISGPAISKHLKVLEEAGLITRRINGKQRRFTMNTDPLKDAQFVISQLTHFWMTRLANLDEFLKNENPESKKK